ncbi:MAG: tetratricopeptide repeat protein [Treponema sp.]|jgi:tetratricopeptide (TPR) repeat protein|nr:tetratricopeptide repeat protein [Treponema sp.]
MNILHKKLFKIGVVRKLTEFPNKSILLSVVILSFALIYASSCATNAASAEEYFSIGMAYFELGKYEEAERWLNRAKSVTKTMVASEYNLGRIAFATGRYEDAAKQFEDLLAKDADNVMALKGAAYSRIKNGDIEKARDHYSKILALVPESADDGFNYALVLYAMNDFETCEQVLYKYDYSLEENNEALLLLARAQSAGNKPEAVDSYDKWLAFNATNANIAQIYYEHGKELEKLELYAKAVEQYRAGLEASGANAKQTPPKKDFLFEIGRLLLIVDPESEDGITELNAAREAGFADREALEGLLQDERISGPQKENISEIIEGLNKKP